MSESWADVVEEWQGLHQRLSVMLRGQSRRTTEASFAGLSTQEEHQLLGELAELKEDVEWHLVQAHFEAASQGCVHGPSLRALGSPDLHAVSEPVLHTRLVSNEEVRENLGRWAPAMASEYRSLLSKGAIEEVSDETVQEWISAGKDIEVLPGRGVPTEKPPLEPGGKPREKYRAVICGNFQKASSEKEGQSFYAGGADSISIRTVLRWGGLNQCGVSGVDIKTAFLNAPVDSSEPEFLICNPPRHMIAAGLVPPKTKWRVRGALYGLVSSPRSSSIHRDKVLRSCKWECRDQSRVMRQCIADPNVWKILDQSTSELVALMTCYVDDILVVGKMEERMAFLEHLKTIWETSQPEHSEQSTVTYCGQEIVSSGQGLSITQSKYIQELLQRHEVQEEAPTPYVGWKEKFDDTESREKDPNPEEIRAAQSITGETLWLVVRSRPDLSFAVTRMSQLSTKRPKDTLAIGKAVLKYLKGSAHRGLLFGPATGGLGNQQHLTRPDTHRSLNVYADASFAPGGGRSCQGIVVHWAGEPVQWEASRQTLTSLSTAESELTGLVSAVQIGQAVASLIEEIVGLRLERCLYGDNQASLAIAQGPTSWRTRHLRIRSSVLRDLVDSGEWALRHISGEILPADLLTKSLPAVRFRGLLDSLGVKSISAEKISKAQVSSRSERLKKAAIAVWALSVPHMLKGLDPGSDDAFWMWLIAVAFGVIMLWEGLKMACRPCVRAFRAQEQLQPVQVNVHVDSSRASSSGGGSQASIGAQESRTDTSVYGGALAARSRDQVPRETVRANSAPPTLPDSGHTHCSYDQLRRAMASEPKLWGYKR